MTRSVGCVLGRFAAVDQPDAAPPTVEESAEPLANSPFYSAVRTTVNILEWKGYNAWLMRVDKAGKTIEFQYGNYSKAEDALVFPQRVDSRSAENYWVYYRKQ